MFIYYHNEYNIFHDNYLYVWLIRSSEILVFSDEYNREVVA